MPPTTIAARMTYPRGACPEELRVSLFGHSRSARLIHRTNAIVSPPPRPHFCPRSQECRICAWKVSHLIGCAAHKKDRRSRIESVQDDVSGVVYSFIGGRRDTRRSAH